MTTIQINYKKDKPADVNYLANAFSSLDNPEFLIYSHNSENVIYNPFHIRNIQNYNPIYGRFFALTENNYNKVVLNQKYGIRESQLVEQETGEVVDKPIFFKFAPLLDPIRYMIGKYDLNEPTLKVMPSILKTEGCFPKIADPNNVSYIDSFFCYLGSQLLHKNNMFHSPDFYGSYVGIQELFKTNITDEMEYLQSSDFFGKHLNADFYVKNPEFSEYMNYGSRKNRQRIQIGGDSRCSCISLGAEEFESIGTSSNIDLPTSLPVASPENIDSTTVEEVYEKTPKHNLTILSESTTSSQNSDDLNYSSNEEEDDEDEKPEEEQESDKTEKPEEEQEDETQEDEDDEWETESDSETQEEEIFAYIKDFPTQMICMEKCDGTLDDLFMNDEIDVKTAASCLFQIIMALIVFQKAFHFTHNDLHTNNIMYVKTDVEYVYYCFQSTYYRVPTYGRIFKIIDFGRSIYTFQGKTFCSDSFDYSGDAYSQYNCEPYINNNKPRIDPNPSFDLCRLGCSIYDFIMDDDETVDDELRETIVRWCSDDNGKNILYKRNGDERYPGFKLYKMIARNVHRHSPQEQLKFPYFSQFEIPAKKMKKYDVNVIKQNGINVDDIPSYVL